MCTTYTPKSFQKQVSSLNWSPKHITALVKTSTYWAHYKIKMASSQRIAIVSVYDKTGLLDLAKGLIKNNVRILASGGTSKMIRESGFPVE